LQKQEKFVSAASPLKKMAKTFLDSPNLPILILGGAGIYFLYKSDFFKGLGGVSEGAGTAVQGLGSGISEAAGGLGQGISNIGTGVGSSVSEILGGASAPFGFIGDVFSGQADIITTQQDIIKNASLREASQANVVDYSAFAQSQDALAQLQAAGDINATAEFQNRRSLREDNKTDFTRYLTNLDENVISIAKSSAATAAGLIANAARKQTELKQQVAAATKQGVGVFLRASQSSFDTARSLRSSISGIATSRARKATATAQAVDQDVAEASQKTRSLISSAATRAKNRFSSFVNSAKSLLRRVHRKRSVRRRLR